MKQQPELLVPVGGIQQLYAAVENGADAVYFGGKLFNARQNAVNFDLDDLKSALEYSHIRGVNVYLTMNILISDDELAEALNFVGQVYVLGIDALIVQDIGLAKQINKYFPDLPLHLSTQGTTYNLEGVKFAKKNGFKRVVLARELSIKEIAEITKNSTTEIEVFVHGALCISYSGQCLMSSMVGGRSGNRGKCAQPCRLPYQIGKIGHDLVKAEKGHYLSPKDLSGLNLISQLIKAGITSLKIEGRMKSPEYVAAVTKVYRKYIDLSLENKNYTVDAKDQKTLMQVFNRGGFTTGYLEKKQGTNLISRERPKHWGIYLGKTISYDKRMCKATLKLEDNLSIGDGVEIVNEELSGNIITSIECKGNRIKDATSGELVTIGSLKGGIYPNQKVYRISDKSLNKTLQATFSGKKNIRKFPLKATFTAKIGFPLIIEISDNDGNYVVSESDYITEEAINRAITNDEVLKQLNKTGSTPFEFSEIDVKIDNNASIAVSELNAIRRNALNKIEELRKNRYLNREIPKIELSAKQHNNLLHTNKLSLYLYKWNCNLVNTLMKADRVYIPFQSFVKSENVDTINKLKNSGCEVMPYLPPVTRGKYDKFLKSKLNQLSSTELEGILIGNLSQLEILKKSNIPLYGDYSLNIFNSKSVKTAVELGLKGITMSHELTLKQIKNINIKDIEIETTVYGRIPVMTSEHCPIGAELNYKNNEVCGLCKKGDYYIRDRINKDFPIVCDPIDCRCTILNADKLLVPNVIDELKTSRVNTFRLYIYDENPEDIEELIKLFNERIIKGKTKKEDVLSNMSSGFTKGHYFRGV